MKTDSTNISDSTMNNVRDPSLPKHLPPYPPLHTFRRSSSSKKRSIASTLAGNNVKEEDAGEGGADGPASKAQRSLAKESTQKSLSLIEDTVDNSV